MPKSLSGQFGLGYTDYMLGNYAAAEQELQTASDLSPAYAYSLLWLHLARMRQGKNDRADFAQRAAKVSMTAWPAPVLQYFLGQIYEAGVITASLDPDPLKDSDQECETKFYIGEDQLIHNNPARALLNFKYAAGICPKRYVEYGATVGELAHMATVAWKRDQVRDAMGGAAAAITRPLCANASKTLQTACLERHFNGSFSFLRGLVSGRFR